MIISRTPLRISFAGGGSDLPSFYLRGRGAVIGTAINKYIYITVNKKFDDRIRVSYSVTEIVDRIDDIQHEIVREALRLVGISGGIEITSISDIPSRGTGLGSSSAFTVGLLNALYAYRGVFASAERLAKEACQIEIDICGKPIGKQDQYFSSFGGMKYIQFGEDEVRVDPVICSRDTIKNLHNSLLMLYTGITRHSDSVLDGQSQNDNWNNLSEMVCIAQKMKDSIQDNHLEQFGELLHENWALKRQLADNVSNDKIDLWYNLALENGADGGKILGAGGGGFLLFYVSQDNRSRVINALELRETPFLFEPQGSKIIYVGE